MNKKLLILIAFISSVFLFSPKTNAQVCQNLDAGDDVQMQCTDNDVTLTATVIAPNYKTTRNYDVGDELLCPPVTYDGSRTFIQTDDEWSDFVIDIPFTFCFFENQYDQLLISGNGIVTFDLTVLNAFSDWVVADGLQLPTQEWQTNAIFGVYHDMDSRVQAREDRISYKTLGVAPNRVFVISFEAYQYSCNELLSKSQIKLYESSNVIDVLVDEKPVCSGWNGGRAVVGIQNKSGTIGVAPPNRNNGVWTPAVGGELWRFVPNGQDMEYFLRWYDQDGNQINANNEESITVNPQEETTYTAELTLVDQCNDSTAVITDDVTITPAFTPDLQTPLNLVECENPIGSGTADFDIDQTTYVLNGLNPADYNISYHTSFDDADAGTNPIAVLNPYTSAGNETIFIRVEDATDPTCKTIRSFTLSVDFYLSNDISYNPTVFCVADANPTPDTNNTPGGVFSINNGGVINSATGEIDLAASDLGTDGTGNFTVSYLTTSGTCPHLSPFDITITYTYDSNFIYPSTVCIGGDNPTALITGNPGGTFSVDNGATIDPVSGELDLSTTTAGTIYTVTYAFTGNCASSTTQQVEVLPMDDSSFTYATNLYCDDDVNPTPNSITLPGGSFDIDNGGAIDVGTGEINLSASGLGTDGTGNFTVSYTTNGDCPTTSTFTITIEHRKDASFTYPTTACIDGNNPVATITGDTGGTFSVDNGATIDPVTGALDLSTTTAGTIYTVTYAFAGNCPSATTQQIVVLPMDDSSFTYATNLYCDDDVDPIPDSITLPGGSFDIDNGGVIDIMTGEIDLSASGLGTDGTGDFTVSYTSNGDCPTTSPFAITIEHRKDASFTYPSSICLTDDNPVATITGDTDGTFSVDNGATIDASTGELDLDTTIEGENYTITYAFAGNCPISSQQVIHIDESPTATAPTTILESCNNGDNTANFDILSIENEIVGSQTNVSVTYHATQNDAESGANAMATNPFLIASGNVWARVENAQGCYTVVEVPLVINDCILIIPQGFSPNSNIVENQTFNLPGIRTRYPSFEVYVYNRYGNEVYSGNINNDDWNGKLNNDGDLLPAGTYFYGIKLNDEEDIQYRGWVYLNY